MEINERYFTDLTVLPLSANLTDFQVSIAPKTVDKHTYNCWFETNGHGFRSTVIALTVEAQLDPQPILNFTSTKADTANSRIGICTLQVFQPAGHSYSVQFLTTQGAESVNLLASYLTRRKCCEMWCLLYENLTSKNAIFSQSASRIYL